MSLDRDVSDCLHSCFCSFIDFSCTEENIVFEKVQQLLLSFLLIMNVQELAFSFVDTKLLEFSLEIFHLCLFILRISIFIKNIEGMNWNSSIFNEFNFLLPMCSLFVIFCSFPVFGIFLLVCCIFSIFLDILNSIWWCITNNYYH